MEVLESCNQSVARPRMSARRRSQTVSEYLQELLPARILRTMLTNRGIRTNVWKALDGQHNVHLVNAEHKTIMLTENRTIMPGEAFCGRKSWAYTKIGAIKKGVTCEGCIHISRSLLARTILKTR